MEKSNNSTLQKISDKLEINEQISKFAFYRDELKMENLLSLFTDDAVIEWITGKNEQEFLWKGKLEIKKGFGKYFDQARNLKVPFKFNKGITTRHILTNPIYLELTKNNTKTKTAFLVTWTYNSKKTGIKNKPNTIYQGYYEDEFIKTSKGWKIAKKKVITSN